MDSSGGQAKQRRTVSTVVVLVFVALVLAAVESLGSGFAAHTPAAEGDAGPAVGIATGSNPAGVPVVRGGRAAGSGPTLEAVDVDALSSSIALPPVADPLGSAAPGPPAPGMAPPSERSAPSGLLHPTGGPTHQVSGGGSGSVSDPHRLVDPAGRGSDLRALPPDSTPLAAAAGSEPASMGPLTGIPTGWVSSVHRFTFASMMRSYLMLRPRAKSPTPLPVVVVLHGRALTPADIERLSRMPVTTGPAIQVYPAGYGRSWNAGGCCGVAHTARIDDVAFLVATVKQVLAGQRDAAANRVYLVGYSNGGRMAYRMQCADPGMWAGVAAVEAVPVDSCASTLPVPVLVVASSNDPLLTIQDGRPRKVMQGYLQPTVQTTVDRWRRLDGCSAAISVSVTGRATVDTWDHCRAGGRVAYALYRGGSHAWPAGAEGAAGTPSAEDLLWGWLRTGTVISAAAA